MTEWFPPDVLYTTIVDRVMPLAGRGDVNQIRIAIGPLLHDRPGLAQHLADLKPQPWLSSIERNDIVVALAEHGDIWPRSIAAGLIVAELEHRAMKGHGEFKQAL